MAKEWDYRAKDGGMTLAKYLSVGARVMLVCQGDEEHFKLARRVSDDFEHGLRNSGALIAPAKGLVVKLARYVREAILTALEVSDATRAVLTSEQYSRPRGPSGPERYFSATIKGEGEELAAEGRDHPCMEWTHSIKQAAFDPDTGRYAYTPEEKLTASFAPSYRMEDGHLEIWDGGTFNPTGKED